ncbi:hypothetical protein QL285_002810 [Trifolium repens]|nr:hypothetical protein QL285_002810 [Trifolium repens]
MTATLIVLAKLFATALMAATCSNIVFDAKNTFCSNFAFLSATFVAAKNDISCSVEQQGITHVIVESDSKSVVDAIQHVHGGSSEFSFIILQINNILSCNQNFVVKFVKRQANMVAHTLARATISQLAVVALTYYFIVFRLS